MEETPKLYRELAAWWPLLSAPEDYAEEAEDYRRLILEGSDGEARDVLELGSGGGNNASHLKAHFRLTLVDRSPQMLDVSRRLNPECDHVEGDMRSVRLGRTFDAVFVHDAIAYMTTEDDLRGVFATAFEHCRAGGVALFVPDHVTETFETAVDHGGHDGPDRALRYLEWTWDPDPNDSTIRMDLTYVFHEPDGLGAHGARRARLRAVPARDVAPADRGSRVRGAAGSPRARRTPRRCGGFPGDTARVIRPGVIRLV